MEWSLELRIHILLVSSDSIDLEEWMSQIQYIIIIKLYITVNSNIKRPTVITFSC